MHPSQVLAKLKQGRTAFGTSLHLTDPSLFEMAGAMGLDAIWLDLEHHATSDSKAQELIRAARAGGPTDMVVRIGKGEFMRMGRVLEAGAHGIMYPRCESRQEAAEVVRWSKFAPVGERGFDGAGADSDYMAHPMEEYLRRADANTFTIVQVEDERSLAHCEEIIAVPGIDMLMLGPADFSILIGKPGDFSHPRVIDAQRRVAAAASEAGKHWAATSVSMEHARQLVRMGASLIFNGADIVFVHRGLAALRETFGQLESPHATNGALPVAAPKIQPVTCAGSGDGSTSEI